MAQLGLKERFFLICWKNWKAAWVYRYILLLAILTPSFFVSILVAIRNFNKVQRYDAKIYQPINLTAEWKKFTQRIAVIHDKLAEKGLHLHNCFVPQLIVGYAPKNSVFRDLMMRASVNYLDNITLIGFESDEALRMAMEKEHFLAGVSFNGDKNEESEEKLKGFYSLSVAGELFNLEYSLIFPSELRFFADSFIGQSWRTNTLVFPYSELEIKSSTESTNYVREGFISLQNAVSMSYIHTIGIMGNVPEVKLNQFPRRTHIFDPMLSHLAFILPFLIAIGYMCLLLIFSIRLVTQKLYRRKKILHVLGIDRRIHTFTWLVAGNVLLVVPVICVLFSIKIGVVDGYSLCSQSSWSALLFFLLCYNISSVCFCFMASSLVKTVPNAMILVGVLWILSFLPYMTSSTEYPLGKAKQLVSALCANTVFGYGFEKIVEFERKEVGLQWSNFFEFHKSDRVASVGVQCVLLICLSISYTALGLILYKLPVVCKKIYKEAKNKLLDVRPHREHMSDHVRTSNSMLNFRKTKVLEVQNEDKKVLIEVKNLTKKYHDKVVINSLSFNIYEGEVTVVMGHNGCGKTTLLTMIAGITHPTSGSIESNEVSLTLIFEFELRIGIGVPYMLHPELTVAEQIILYSRLRGLDMNKAQEEVEKYTQALNLENVTGVLTYKLSNCLQQCLTVCCSLCGNSTLVVLDEPSSGVDLTCKRKIWDLIIKEKMKRTIIISTHSAQEAEILGDHLLVLSGGEIMCYGSMFFMKSIYGKGYRLICHKTPYCDTGNVTMFLRNYIPQISPEADIGMELSYRLQERYFVVFNKLLADLEESFQKLEIKGCSISEPIVEDIVLLMGSEDSTESELFRQSDVMQGHTIYAEEYKKYSFMEDFDIYTGLKLFIIHLHAILLKNLHSNSHKEKVLLFICLPASVTFLTYIMSDPTLDRVPLHPITFRITQYAESVTPISGNLFDFDQKVYNLFLDYFTDLPSMSVVHKLEIIRSSNFTEAILEKEDSQKGFNEKYLVGASFERNEPIAWYNNYWLHTAPLSLNLLHNGILSALHHSGRITVIHDPLPLRTLEDLPDLRTMTHIGNLLALMLSYLISFIYSYGLFFSINEKAMRFKLTQFIFGIRHAELYIGAFVYDLAKIIIISLSVLLISLLYRDNIPDQNRSALFCFLIMIVFGICITPYYYLVSLMLKDATPGYWFVCFHNVFGVSCFMALLETIDSHQITELEMSTTSEWLSYLLPHFILCKALTKVFSIGKARFICQNEDVRTISLVLDGCKTAPNCCIEPKEFEWRYWGILPEIKYFLILGSVATILLCICELHVYWKRLLCFTIPQDN